MPAPTPISVNRPAIVLLVLAALIDPATAADGPGFLKQFRFSTRDSLDTSGESSADARDCLKGLAWTPGRFTIDCRKPIDGRGDALVRFPSPVPVGMPTNDRVAMEWYVAGADQAQPRRARSIIVVHESGRGMTVGRIFAASLRKQGLHAFLLQLPGYGQRAVNGRPPASRFFPLLRQAIADIRRARDAVLALPLIDPEHVSLQGTSLGGFVVATAAGLDNGFDSVFVTLAGGNLYDLIQHGQRDTAKIRERLTAAGVTDRQLKEMARRIEPTRLAHRINPKRLWLFSATRDTVVPLKNALALAEAARLPGNQHVKLPADHYTGIIFLPSMCQLIARQVQSLPRSRR